MGCNVKNIYSELVHHSSDCFYSLCYRCKDGLMFYWCIVNVTMCYITLRKYNEYARENMLYTFAVSSLFQLKLHNLFYDVL